MELVMVLSLAAVRVQLLVLVTVDVMVLSLAATRVQLLDLVMVLG